MYYSTIVIYSPGKSVALYVSAAGVSAGFLLFATMATTQWETCMQTLAHSYTGLPSSCTHDPGHPDKGALVSSLIETTCRNTCDQEFLGFVAVSCPGALAAREPCAGRSLQLDLHQPDLVHRGQAPAQPGH